MSDTDLDRTPPPTPLPTPPLIPPLTPLLGDEEQRLPAFELHYRGRVNAPDPYVPMGPNLWDEPMWPVAVRYDPEKDVTTLGLSYIRPDFEKRR